MNQQDFGPAADVDVVRAPARVRRVSPPGSHQDVKRPRDNEDTVCQDISKNSVAGTPTSAGPFTIVRLGGLHITGSGSGPRPLKSQLAAGFSCPPGEQLLLDVEADTDFLVCYKAAPSSASNSQVAKADTSRCKTSNLDVALSLPLLCAFTQRVSEKFAKDKHVLRLVLPAPETVPEAMRPDITRLQPAKSDGVWLLEFETEDDLQHVLDQLQSAGCILQGFEDQFEIGQLLGVGSFAKVFYALNTRKDYPAACKVIRMENPVKDAALMKEVRMLRRSCHQSVLKFIGLFLDSDPIDGKFAWIIITEFVGGGALFERVRERGPLPEDRAAFIIMQLLSALRSMHRKGIVHRDIKTENVILTEREADQVKLVDYGLATLESDEQAMKTRCGSPGYIAPEVLRSERYGCKVDCFSVGVLLYILLIGRGPFRGKGVEEMLVRNMRCNVKRCALVHLSQDAQDFVLMLLSADPSSRPSAADSLDLPWLASTAGMQREFGSQNWPLDLNQRDTGFSSSHGMPEKRRSSERSTKGFSSLLVEADKDFAGLSAHFTDESIDAPLLVGGAAEVMKRQSSGGSANIGEPILEEQDVDLPLEDVELNAELASIPPLRSESPLFADMQDALTSLRAVGMSPRTTFRDTSRLGQDGRPSARFTIGQDGRISDGRVSGYSQRGYSHHGNDDSQPMSPRLEGQVASPGKSGKRTSNGSSGFRRTGERWTDRGRTERTSAYFVLDEVIEDRDSGKFRENDIFEEFAQSSMKSERKGSRALSDTGSLKSERQGAKVFSPTSGGPAPSPTLDGPTGGVTLPLIVTEDFFDSQRGSLDSQRGGSSGSKKIPRRVPMTGGSSGSADPQLREHSLGKRGARSPRSPPKKTTTVPLFDPLPKKAITVPLFDDALLEQVNDSDKTGARNSLSSISQWASTFGEQGQVTDLPHLTVLQSSEVFAPSLPMSNRSKDPKKFGSGGCRSRKYSEE